MSGGAGGAWAAAQAQVDRLGGAIDPAVTLPAGASAFERIAAIGAADRARLIGSLGLRIGRWDYVARAAQWPPEGDWRTWLILAGRGFGKTRAGAEWVKMQAETHPGARIALVGASLHEARAVMVEGESGLIAIMRGAVKYEASLRRLSWGNGTQAYLYSAGEPDSLRGPQHHFAWCDEIGKWPRGEEAWDTLAMGLRLGGDPRTVVTTTPRAVPLVRRLGGLAGVTITRGRTRDNRAHLAPSFLEMMNDQHGGTRFGRQELDGELIEEIEGALWSRAAIDACRVRAAPDLVRIVIGVDPPAGTGASSDACGIVVAGLCAEGRAYVLADASVQGASPEGWAAAVARAAEQWRADRVIAEANNGGAMVESVLRAADETLPVLRVHAAHGKVARAEPVQALYARGRVFHAGAFAALEDEMCGLLLGGGYEGPGRSPDRADALVWAITELMLGKKARPGVRGF
ncbi:DNA-packaging protein [Sphingomonas sp. AP4-R1]|uniref:DNA-packaging protein n=1 Tax=Sphingomonas sp. AP4-R1 TaxID=2735134 RepID=UPI0014938D68|nr:terminase family protein [Sphingomonas sp. AP4-R1]QJU57534.1 DNA-packaging protein [Sphingomonas sp. AP4-R1]